MPYLMNTLFALFFLIYVTVFLLFPNIDLYVTHLFYELTELNEPHFVGNANAFIRWWYELFAWIIQPIVALLVILILMGYAAKFFTHTRYSNKLKALLPYSWFLLLLIICVALVVEVFLKEGVGRPRPRDILTFGGDLIFVPFMNISDQCSYNCSFASGHAALGFLFMAIAWIKRSALWLIPGLLLGGLLAYVRISMGGHFLSDVLMPLFLVFLFAQCLSRWWLNFWFK